MGRDARNVCLPLLVLSLFCACKKRSPDIDQSQAASAPQEPVGRPSVLKDAPDFDLESLKKGAFCGAFKRGEFRFEFQPFPAAIRQALDRHWNLLSFRGMFETRLKGVYLAAFATGANPAGASSTGAAAPSAPSPAGRQPNGVTCQDGDGGNWVVILNASLLSQRRGDADYDNATYNIDQRPFGYYSARGDEVVNTFVHELFHVLDFARLRPGISLPPGTEPQDVPFGGTPAGAPMGAAEADMRRRYFALSWANEQASLFPAMPDIGVVVPGMGTVPSAYAGFKHVFTLTNFFEPNAATNPWEDFASTLEFVYVTKTYGFWPAVSYYPPVTASGTQERFDSKEVVANSPRHKEKYCLLVNWFWPGHACP